MSSIREGRTIMRARSIVALSMLAGAVIGGAITQGVFAQTKPPIYMIAINEVIDQEGYLKQYLPAALKTLKDHGGVLIAGAPGTPIDGAFPKGRVVILKWESMEAL